MIAHAKQLSKAGRTVYLVMATEAAARGVRDGFGRDFGIQVETPESVRPQLDWHTLTLRGAHPKCFVLVDHHVIEQRFGPLLKMLHAYDPHEIDERCLPADMLFHPDDQAPDVFVQEVLGVWLDPSEHGDHS